MEVGDNSPSFHLHCSAALTLESAQELHDFVCVLGLQLFNDMQVCHLRRRHIGMAESFGHRRDRHSCVEQQRCVRMPQAMNGDDRNTAFPADRFQPIIHGCVEHTLALDNEYRLIRVAADAQMLEMHAERPIHPDLPTRGGILRRRKAAFRILVVPGLLYIDLLHLKIDVVRGQPKGFPESQACFGNQKK